MQRFFQKSIFWGVVVAVAVTYWLDSKEELFMPERPSAVPLSAQLVGGIDGWDWVDCKSTSTIHLECKIFDQTGLVSRTSYLRPCFNLKVKSSSGLNISHINETLVTLKEVNLFEYKPSVIEGVLNNNELAIKYYKMWGVDENCKPVSVSSELEAINL